MKKNVVPYVFNDEMEYISDQLGVAELPLYTYESTVRKSDLSMLSLISGCGGMEIGFEGGFMCHRKAVPKNFSRIEYSVNDNWNKQSNKRNHLQWTIVLVQP